ncbi:MAG: winged helix DNA-binding domain-containing protein [Actinomycetes bacterium]
MSTTRPETVLRRRVFTQRLAGRKLPEPEDVVRLLAAVQSQECAHGFWSLGMRTNGSTYADVRRAFDEGRILRTHMLRTTWHFVTPEDIRWILGATSPRVLAAFGSSFRAHGLDDATQRETGDLVVKMLEGGAHLTRREIGAELERHGEATAGQRLAYIVMSAELRGLVCSGPMRGAQHTYAVLDERVPPGPTYQADEALAELAFRFFAGHGPASLRDFTRWSSLTVADARTAIAAVGDRLAGTEVDGESLWFDPEAPRPRSIPLTAYLLPLYDEAVLTYPRLNFPTAPGHPHPPDMDLFIGSVIVGERNVGTWRRTISGKSLSIETALVPSLDEEHLAAVSSAVDRLTVFLGHPPAA